MPTHTFRQSIAAGASFNGMQGSQYEYMPFPAMIEIGINSEGAAGSILATVQSGPDVLAEEQPIPVVAANTWPKYPDDYHWQDEVAAGDKIKINLRNTTAGAVVVNGLVKISPLGA